MKFCEKCWSEKLVQSPGLIICKGCGHSKKVLNIVVNNDVDSGLYGKRHQSFITQKSTAKNKMIEDITREDVKWQQHIATYQKTMKAAMEEFISHHSIGSQYSSLILDNLKWVWMKYLRRWKETGTPINSIFTSNTEDEEEEDEEGLEQIEQTDLKEEEQDEQGRQFEEVNTVTMSRRRRSTLVEFELDEDVELIKEQHLEQPTTKHQLITTIRSLTVSMTMNTHIYFKKLLKIKEMAPQLVPMTVRTYVKRLNYLYAARYEKTEKMMSYYKFQKLYLRTAWLREMVQKRNQARAEAMSDQNLITYIFVFDLLQYKLSIKSTENSKTLEGLVEKYTKTKKLDNKFINVVLNKYKLKTQYESLFVREEKVEEQEGLPPDLNFHLIYSFIQVALVKSKQVFHVTEIIEYIILKQQFWLETPYLKVNSTPSIQRVVSNSIQLIHTLKIKFDESNRGRWMKRITNEMGLQQYKNVLEILVKTLIVQPDWIVNEDVECLAIIVIFCKLMVNMDQQQNVALMPWQRISQKYNVVQNQPYRRIISYLQRIDKMMSSQFKSQLNLNIKTIISNIRKWSETAIAKKKFQKIKDLADLDLKKFQTTRRLDELPFVQNRSYLKSKQIFSKTQLQPTKQQKQMTINVTIDQPKRQVQLKQYLLNQLPKDEEQQLLESDIILPSNNYETITDYRSNYYPIGKNEFMELLGAVSKGRCSIDELYKKVEELEKQLVLFQTG